MAFQTGDRVLYRGLGVCEVTGVTSRTFSGMPPRDYYVLQPVFADHAISYLPVQIAEQKLRPLHSLEEIRSMLQQTAATDLDWEEDGKERKEQYRNILKQSECRETLQMLKQLSEQKEKRKAIGKQLSSSDEENLKIGERILHEELAVLLNISPEEAAEYIQKELAEIK